LYWLHNNPLNVFKYNDASKVASTSFQVDWIEKGLVEKKNRYENGITIVISLISQMPPSPFYYS